MNLRDYIHQLDPAALSAYAIRCGIAESYLRLHVKYASKDPSVSLIRSLVRESEGSVSLTEVLEHFGVTEHLLSETAQTEKRRPKGRPVPPDTHHHSAVGSR